MRRCWRSWRASVRSRAWTHGQARTLCGGPYGELRWMPRPSSKRAASPPAPRPALQQLAAVARSAVQSSLRSMPQTQLQVLQVWQQQQQQQHQHQHHQQQHQQHQQHHHHQHRHHHQASLPALLQLAQQLPMQAFRPALARPEAAQPQSQLRQCQTRPATATKWIRRLPRRAPLQAADPGMCPCGALLGTWGLLPTMWRRSPPLPARSRAPPATHAQATRALRRRRPLEQRGRGSSRELFQKAPRP